MGHFFTASFREAPSDPGRGNAQRTGHHNEQHRGQVGKGCSCQHSQKNQECGEVYHVSFEQLEHGVQDQHAYAGAYAVEGVLYNLQIGKIGEQPCNHADNDKAGERLPQGCYNTADDTGFLRPIKVATLTAMMPGVHCPMA